MAAAKFHQLVDTASCLGTAVEVYHETLAELYGYFNPYPIEKLHKSNHDHVALVAALCAGSADEAVEVSRKHVGPASDDVYGTVAERSLNLLICLPGPIEFLDCCPRENLT